MADTVKSQTIDYVDNNTTCITVSKFHNLVSWTVCGRKIEIDKMEKRVHSMNKLIRSLSAYESKAGHIPIQNLPISQIKDNVLVNTASVINGEFIRKTTPQGVIICARISDVIGSTLIINEWDFPEVIFNLFVSKYVYDSNSAVKEHLFYIKG